MFMRCACNVHLVCIWFASGETRLVQLYCKIDGKPCEILITSTSRPAYHLHDMFDLAPAQIVHVQILPINFQCTVFDRLKAGLK